MGDGVLLEFPSVVDAVECAVAVQAVMAQRNEGIPQDRRMLFRIGINLGDILIEGDDILGDGVNVAARLEGIAEPGGVSSSAYEHVRGKISADLTDLGNPAGCGRFTVGHLGDGLEVALFRHAGSVADVRCSGSSGVAVR
jgi:class 3 adenylate cyclase